jgi:hypothetical protein
VEGKPSTLPASTDWQEKTGVPHVRARGNIRRLLLETAAAEPRRRTRKVHCRPLANPQGWTSGIESRRNIRKDALQGKFSHRDTIEAVASHGPKVRWIGEMSRSTARKGARAVRSMRSVNAAAFGKSEPAKPDQCQQMRPLPARESRIETRVRLPPTR